MGKYVLTTNHLKFFLLSKRGKYDKLVSKRERKKEEKKDIMSSNFSEPKKPLERRCAEGWGMYNKSF